MVGRFGTLRCGLTSPWMIVTVLAVVVVLPAHAQEGITIRRDLRAVRVAQPPVIDGDLSDPCWQEAAKLERWTDVLYSNPVQDQTIGYLGFDDKNIYVAFRAFDSQPTGILARETKRGTRFTGYDDFVAFAIDPFHTHQFRDRAFFIINPIGTQFAHLMGDRAVKLEWEGKWQAAAKIVSDGWTGEMAIPWAILNYPAAKGPVTAGINMDRFQQRTKIHSLWCNYGPQELNELEGHWVGVQFPPYRPSLSLLPYASIGWREKRGASLRSGVDARYTPTPLLTLVGTINPDFENVEEAVEGIDFSYGPRFVPDRRPFFQEGASIYSAGGIPGRYFHSRQIGPFDTGVNLYGKLNQRDTIGMLAAVDWGQRADWILRGRHAFGETSNVNIALMNRDDEAVTNRVLVLGEDFRRGFWNFDTSAATSWVSGQTTGSAGNAFFIYRSPRWLLEVAPHFVEPGFRDDLGFIPFTDYKGLNNFLLYETEWRRGPIRGMSAGGSTRDSHHYDGRLFRQQREVFAGLQTRNDYSFSLGWSGGRFEEFDDSVITVRVRARVSDPFHNFGIGLEHGRRAGDPITFLTPSATWRFGNKLTLGINSAILHHTEDRQQHVVTFNYDFSPQQGIGGRVVAQTGGTNGYLAYRRSGYGGVETFLILGDPNALKFRERVVLKVVWAM
jgi:hypothetical protein